MFIRKKYCLLRFSSVLFIAHLLLTAFFCTSCTKKDYHKTKPIEFTVVAERDIPEKLLQVIEEKKKSPLELSYSDGKFLYIVKGYGAQNTTDFSIVVNDLYLSDNTIIFDTDLFGPDNTSSPKNEVSYPFIVVKSENMDNDIIFK